MVVAVTLLGSVALIIGMASSTFYKTYERTQKHVFMLQQYRGIDAVMDNCVRNMIPFRWPDRDDNDESVLVFDGQSDSIHFTTIRRDYGGGDGAFLFIRLKFEYGELIAEYSPYPRLPNTKYKDELEYTREVLATSVRNVRFLYAYRNTGDTIEWMDTWDEDTYNYTPLAVQITVEWENGQLESWLRRTAGSGAYSAFGNPSAVITN